MADGKGLNEVTPLDNIGMRVCVVCGERFFQAGGKRKHEMCNDCWIEKFKNLIPPVWRIINPGVGFKNG